MGIDKHEFRIMQARCEANRKRIGSRSSVQEQEEGNTGSAHGQDADIDRCEVGKVDGESISFYRVSIILRVSDRRARDADGAVTTLLDTILNAIGRLVNMDRTRLRAWAKSEERRRRS